MCSSPHRCLLRVSLATSLLRSSSIWEVCGQLFFSVQLITELMFFVVDFFASRRFSSTQGYFWYHVLHVAYPNLQAFHPEPIETTPDLPDTVSLRIQASRLSI